MSDDRGGRSNRRSFVYVNEVFSHAWKGRMSRALYPTKLLSGGRPSARRSPAPSMAIPNSRNLGSLSRWRNSRAESGRTHGWNGWPGSPCQYVRASHTTVVRGRSTPPASPGAYAIRVLERGLEYPPLFIRTKDTGIIHGTSTPLLIG